MIFKLELKSSRDKSRKKFILTIRLNFKCIFDFKYTAMKKKKEKIRLTKQEALHADNEIMKLKLEMEFGAHIQKADDSKLPAEVENDWLNSVYEFEKQYQE